MKSGRDDFFNRNHTYITIEEPAEKMIKESRNLFMGSCFAENLYRYFERHYLDCEFSPFGNIYNPLSLASSLKRLCSNNSVRDEELFIHRELWRHSDFDTEQCLTDKKKYLNRINDSIRRGSDYLKKADNLILTLGTSFVYREKETGTVVNNCHKLPSSHFIRENASITEMTEKMLLALQQAREINPKLNIIMTLSPVRHLRDSATENSLGKARLRCLIDELSQTVDLDYFPSYELMMDQLRDYRWYGDDLTHPSNLAVDYIMKKFIENYTDSGFQNYLDDIRKLNLNLNHRILNRETEEAAKFVESKRKKFAETVDKYPSMIQLQKAYNSHLSGNAPENTLI